METFALIFSAVMVFIMVVFLVWCFGFYGPRMILKHEKMQKDSKSVSKE
ncbi:hypothetical protein DCO58_00880 [Helicobacter saguini]|uniref:Uncharacterized protein n=1 Tax=Helicobacter saguini TaxID=1548018 RepID=A0A6B0HQP2_9HELI|nr:hypothetical protein [Helicobacter saguini]MWV63057.1 hypothetical protein [Helicobacter saguini]MWV66274.1 hypothetical protein [Helicobacter saguini]MWV68626.1 hypothetical protein [Helicobacter saguini]MWV71823.1 hypothetical protein [Helicobacter saguini]